MNLRDFIVHPYSVSRINLGYNDMPQQDRSPALSRCENEYSIFISV